MLSDLKSKMMGLEKLLEKNGGRDGEIEPPVMPSGWVQIVGSGIANEGQEIKETIQVKA